MNGIITQSEIDEDLCSFPDGANPEGWKRTVGPYRLPRYGEVLLAMEDGGENYSLWIGMYEEYRGKEWGSGWVAGDGYDMHPAEIRDFLYWREYPEAIKVYAELPANKENEKRLNEYFYLYENLLPHEHNCNYVFSLGLTKFMDISNKELENLKSNGYIELTGVSPKLYSYLYAREGELVL